MKRREFSDRLALAAQENIKEKAYWLDVLSGELNNTGFSFDHKPSASKLNASAAPLEIEFQWSGHLFEQLIKLSKGVDHTIHMILFAAWVLLLEKYTGNTQILLGTTIYRQQNIPLTDLINTVLPLRCRVREDMTFKDLLLHTRETILKANEHQNFPVEVMLDELGLSMPDESNEWGFPLFDTALLLKNIHDPAYMGGIRPLVLVVAERTETCLRGRVQFSPLYEKSTIERVLNHYKHILEQTLSDPGKELPAITAINEEEHDKLVDRFNDTAADFPPRLLHTWFEDQAAKTPDNIAVFDEQYKDPASPGKITYAALNKKANQLAHYLRDRGVTRDTPVAVIIEPSVELAIAILGILKAGGGFLPIEPEYPSRRIAAILENSGTSIILTRETVAREIGPTILKNIDFNLASPIVTPSRPQIEDFDSIPLPDRGLVNYDKIHECIGCAMARHTISIQASRGCPYNCAYCHKIWPKSHIVRSAENIYEEIKACYDSGARRFTFLDDVFNLDTKNSTRFLQLIIKNKLDVQLFFPNGLRGDIMTKEGIDLMVEAGAVDIGMALETGSPRIQKLIRKNLNLDKFKENVTYLIEKYPHVILELEIIFGFPTETEEEAMMTFDFVNRLKWVHFPNLHVLKVYRNTDMYRLAIENGVTPEQIDRSSVLAYHHLPDTLPFPKSFARQFQSRFMNEYILNKERLIALLPHQVKTLTQTELLEKYNTYLPMEIKTMDDLLKAADIQPNEIKLDPTPGDPWAAPGFSKKFNQAKPVPLDITPETGTMRVLLLDLSQAFIEETGEMLYDVIEEPLGLMYLMTDLKHTYGPKINGKVLKSRVDFASLEELKTIIHDFEPHLIGIRTLTYYKEFFHRTVSYLRQWNIDIPIIAGGPYATSDYNFALMDHHIDLAVLGEGEETLRVLVAKMMEHRNQLPPADVLKQIKGIAFLEKEERDKVKSINREMIYLDSLPRFLEPYSTENLPVINTPNDLLYMISTSGSTGKPKAIMLEHRTLSNLMQYQFAHTQIDFSGSVLQFASIAFDISVQEVFSTLLSGGCLFPMPNDMLGDIPRFFDFIQDNDISVAFLPPAFLKFIFSEPEYADRFPGNIRHIIAAGEQLVVIEPLRRHLKKFMVVLHNHYGPAETHVVTTLTMDPAQDIPEFPNIGKPIANTQIYILDKHMNPTPTGVPGELFISGIQVARGYLNDVALTVDKFIKEKAHSSKLIARREEEKRLTGSNEPSFPTSYELPATSCFYKTGDLARWLPDGNIEFLGRIDFQVKIRGFRIELGEIEQHLRRFDGVKEAVVIDIKDPNGEKSLCAYFVAADQMDTTDLKDYLLVQVPDFMVPAYFVQVEKIPLTPNGKIDRAALPEPKLKSDTDDYAAPENNTQEQLQDIWADILRVSKTSVSIDDNFFELGGHSLKATIMIAKIHKQLNVKIPLGELFKIPTIRGLSQYIITADTEFHSAITPVENREYYPVSSAQKRMYILSRIKRDNTSDNTPDVVQVFGKLDHSRLQGVVDAIIARHEALRTSFHMINNQPMQRVHAPEDARLEIEFVDSPGFEVQGEIAREQVDTVVNDFIRVFDLEKAPLVRVRLIKIHEKLHILMYDMHHIIKDGTSSGIFIQEFMDLYLGLPLQKPKLQYKDFTIWQYNLFQSGIMKKQEDFWLHVFSGNLQPLNMPTDFTRPPVQSFEGDIHPYSFDINLKERLEAFSNETGATLYMILLAVYTILLSKYSGQDDITVGTPAAGRPHEDLQNIIGMFVNTLAMRNYPSPEKTFKQFLEEVKTNSLNAFENQDYQFEELVNRLGIQPDPARQSLFDTMFAVHDISFIKGKPSREIKNLSFAPYRFANNITQFDIITHVIPTPDRIAIQSLYCTKLFKKETIIKLAEDLTEITQTILKDPNIKIQNITITHHLTEANNQIPEMEFNF